MYPLPSEPCDGEAQPPVQTIIFPAVYQEAAVCRLCFFAAVLTYTLHSEALGLKAQAVEHTRSRIAHRVDPAAAVAVGQKPEALEELQNALLAVF